MNDYYKVLLDLRSLSDDERVDYFFDVFEPQKEEEAFFEAFVPDVLRAIFERCTSLPDSLDAFSKTQKRTFSLTLFSTLFERLSQYQVQPSKVASLKTLVLPPLATMPGPALTLEDQADIPIWVEKIGIIQSCFEHTLTSNSFTHRIDPEQTGSSVGFIHTQLGPKTVQVGMPDSNHPFYFFLAETDEIDVLDSLLQAAQKTTEEMRICFSDRDGIRVPLLEAKGWVFIPLEN